MIEGKQCWIKSWRKTEVITANLHVKPIQLLKTEHTQSHVHKPVQYLHMCKGNEHQKSKVSNPDQALVWQTPLSTRNDSLNIHIWELWVPTQAKETSSEYCNTDFCGIAGCTKSAAGSRDAVHLNHILCQWGVWVQYQWGHSSVKMTARPMSSARCQWIKLSELKAWGKWMRGGSATVTELWANKDIVCLWVFTVFI